MKVGSSRAPLLGGDCLVAWFLCVTLGRGEWRLEARVMNPNVVGTVVH